QGRQGLRPAGADDPQGAVGQAPACPGVTKGHSAMRAATLFPILGLILVLPLMPAAPDRKEEKGPKVVLVIHGGAGVLTAKEMENEKLENGEKLTRAHY